MRARGDVALIALLAVNLRTLLASLPPLLPEVRHDLGLSAAVAGLLTTLPVLLFGLLAPLAPRLGRRVPLERLVAWCAAVTLLAGLLPLRATTAALFAASCLAGAGVALAQVALPALIATHARDALGRAIGAYTLTLPLGAAVAGAAAVPLRGALGGWPAALAIWSAPGLVALLAWLPAARRGTTLLAPPPPLRRVPGAWALAGYFAVQSVAFYAGLAWLPSILRASGSTATAAGLLQGLGAAVSTVTAFAFPVLAQRLAGQVPLLLAAVGLAAGGLAGLLLAPAAATLWMAMYGLGQGGILGLAFVLPGLRASAAGAAGLTATMLCVGYTAGSAGPWLVGLLHDRSGGWTAPLLAMLGTILAGLLPGLRAARPPRAPVASGRGS